MKLNPAKSKYSPGLPPQSDTLTVEAQGNGEKISMEGIAADGRRISYSSTLSYDGKDSPASGTGTPNGGDTVAFKRINANTTETTWKKAGKVVSINRTVISKDGKIRTITSTWTNANGQPTKNVSVWEKQ